MPTRDAELTVLVLAPQVAGRHHLSSDPPAGSLPVRIPIRSDRGHLMRRAPRNRILVRILQSSKCDWVAACTDARWLLRPLLQIPLAKQLTSRVLSIWDDPLFTCRLIANKQSPFGTLIHVDLAR